MVQYTWIRLLSIQFIYAFMEVFYEHFCKWTRIDYQAAQSAQGSDEQFL